jgi:hypothetical protein
VSQPRRARARFSVRFDELAFSEDLHHATPAGREISRAARVRLEREGADIGELAPCDPQHRDGTRLPNCVKTYLPARGGRWRMIFELVRDASSGHVTLTYRAFGLGHPEHPWQPSAYEVAHHRLHAGDDNPPEPPSGGV